MFDAIEANYVATIELFALFEQVLQCCIYNLVEAVRIFFESVPDATIIINKILLYN